MSESKPVPPKAADANASDERSGGSIYILSGRREGLRAAETFLRGRGWTVNGSSDLREAIADILTIKPDVVLVAADHPNSRVRTIPRLVQQAVAAKLVLYADSNSKPLKALALEIDALYQLFPPVSGPAIERMVWRIQRDEKKREMLAIAAARNAGSSSSSIASGGGFGDKNDLIQISSGAGLSPEEQMLAAARAREALNALVFGSDLSAKKTGPQEGALGAQQSAAAEGAGARDGSIRQDGADGGLGDYRPGHAPNADGEDEAAVGSDYASKRDARNRAPVFMQGEGRKRQGRELADPLLDQGTQAALKDETDGDDGSIAAKKVGRVSRIGCIDIEHGRFSGYLLFAWSADRSLELKLLTAVRSRLVSFLKDQGEEIDADAAIMLRTRDVTFEAWAERQAEFLRKSVHEGHEIAVAFFSGRAQDVELGESASKDMVAMNIDDMKGDSVVEFDVYVHFPHNDKYILYTKSGGVFYENQKERLKNKGVAKLHLKKDASENVKGYNIQNHLNERIDSMNGDAEADGQAAAAEATVPGAAKKTG